MVGQTLCSTGKQLCFYSPPRHVFHGFPNTLNHDNCHKNILIPIYLGLVIFKTFLYLSQISISLNCYAKGDLAIFCLTPVSNVTTCCPLLTPTRRLCNWRCAFICLFVCKITKKIYQEISTIVPK